MIPSGLSVLEPMLLGWLVAALRPGAAFLAAPVFSLPGLPVQIRIVIAMALGFPAGSHATALLPETGLVSLAGLLFVIAEIACGLAIGFVVQIGFAAALMAGELISNTMGLGFAVMNDPANGQMSPALAQLLSSLSMFLFLAMDGHLLLAGIIVESYHALPPGAAWLSGETLGNLAHLGRMVFSAGLTLALPVGFTLVLIQLIMGVIGRAAPTLNLFAVGMPATLLAGILLLATALPAMGRALQAIFADALVQAATIAGI